MEVTNISSDQLKSFVERLEKLEEEKGVIQGYIKDVLLEAKSEGFDTAIMKEVLKIRKMKKEDVEYKDELIDLYLNALQIIS